MIINLRGTSGSGKSHIVRELMSELTQRGWSKIRVMRKGRRQPLGYLLNRAPWVGPQGLAIVGHYEAPCGGSDTLPDYETTYGLVMQSHKMGHDVIYEGLLISGESARPIELNKQTGSLHVIALSTPIDECVESINARRQAKSPGKAPIDPRNTRAKARAVEIAMQKITEAGVPAEWQDRDGAARRLRELLRI